MKYRSWYSMPLSPNVLVNTWGGGVSSTPGTPTIASSSTASTWCGGSVYGADTRIVRRTAGEGRE